MYLSTRNLMLLYKVKIGNEIILYYLLGGNQQK
jgi:hypothetical protein